MALSQGMLAAGSGHSLFLKQGFVKLGALWGWGWNYQGQLGDGTVESRSKPLPVEGLSRVVQAVGGGNFSAALLAEGSVYVWGLDSATPRRLEGLPPTVALAAGREHLLCLTKEGEVWALGANEAGQLGDGTQESRLEARPVEGLRGVVALAAGDAHSLALTGEGILYAWGRNEYGQLGDGTRQNRLRPVVVRFP